MEDLASTLTSYAVYALILVLIYTFIAITKAITRELRAKAEKIENEDRRKMILQAFNKVDMLADAAVRATESISAKDIRLKVKAGKLDKQALTALSKEVLTKIKDNIEPETAELLSLPDLDGYIKDIIEVHLDIVKEEHKK